MADRSDVVEAAKQLVELKHRIKCLHDDVRRALRDAEAAERDHSSAFAKLLRVAGVGSATPLRAIGVEGTAYVVVVRYIGPTDDGGQQVEVQVVNQDGEAL